MSSRPQLIRYAVFFAIALMSLAFFRIGYMVFGETDARGPAAVPRIYDYSNLEGTTLQKAAQDRLMGGAKVVSAGSSRGLELGHFVVRNSKGGIMDACDRYQRLSLKFVAGDMAVSGELPELTVQGPCTADADSLSIVALMFDYDPILKAPVQDAEFTDGLDQAVKLSFANVSDAWPRVWVLKSLQLQGEEESLEVTPDDIKRVMGTAPALEW